MVLVLEWRDRGPVSLSTALVVAVWVCTALIVGIPNAVHRNAPANQPYYGNTGNCTFFVICASISCPYMENRVLDH